MLASLLHDGREVCCHRGLWSRRNFVFRHRGTTTNPRLNRRYLSLRNPTLWRHHQVVVIVFDGLKQDGLTWIRGIDQGATRTTFTDKCGRIEAKFCFLDVNTMTSRTVLCEHRAYGPFKGLNCDRNRRLCLFILTSGRHPNCKCCSGKCKTDGEGTIASHHVASYPFGITGCNGMTRNYAVFV